MELVGMKKWEFLSNNYDKYIQFAFMVFIYLRYRREAMGRE